MNHDDKDTEECQCMKCVFERSMEKLGKSGKAKVKVITPDNIGDMIKEIKEDIDELTESAEQDASVDESTPDTFEHFNVPNVVPDFEGLLALIKFGAKNDGHFLTTEIHPESGTIAFFIIRDISDLETRSRAANALIDYMYSDGVRTVRLDVTSFTKSQIDELQKAFVAYLD